MNGRADPPDAHMLVAQLMAGRSAAEGMALLDALKDGRVSSIFEKLQAQSEPTLLPVPTEARGFRVRLDLHDAKPPVWRRLEVPGDLTLPQVHDAIQTAMGWTDHHLHRFRTGRDYRSPHFITEFDLDEGEEGLLEDAVRLDQLLAESGDELWYEYDFGDGWDHRLVVEEVLADPPDVVRCTAGRMACPPEDCGGIGGYQDIVTWVRSGYADAQLPEGFDNAAHAHDWLPVGWHPEHFDVDDTNAALAAAFAGPVAVIDELAVLVSELDVRRVHTLRQLLQRPAFHGPTEVADDDAARMTETYRILLDVIGDGVPLTDAGFMKPALVEQIAERTGITEWWIGKANREDLTPPVAEIRRSARALGLVSVRKGRLAPAAAVRRHGQDPQFLWRHIVDRLPLGAKGAEQEAGLIALAVVGSEAPPREWRHWISELLHDLGWRSGSDLTGPPSTHSETLDVLSLMAGATRSPRGDVESLDPALAATARAAIRRT